MLLTPWLCTYLFSFFSRQDFFFFFNSSCFCPVVTYEYYSSWYEERTPAVFSLFSLRHLRHFKSLNRNLDAEPCMNVQLYSVAVFGRTCILVVVSDSPRNISYPPDVIIPPILWLSWLTLAFACSSDFLSRASVFRGSFSPPGALACAEKSEKSPRSLRCETAVSCAHFDLHGV